MKNSPLAERFKRSWDEFLLGGTDPHEVALGFALGSFIALLPTFGFSALLGILLMMVFPRLNRPAVFLALALWNPLVQIPIYALSFGIGSELFGNAPVIKYQVEILNQLYTFTRRFLVGHLLLTAAVTVITYVVVWVLSRRLFMHPAQGG